MTIQAAAAASAKDPAAWVAFAGFVLGGLQTLLGAPGAEIFDAATMGRLTLALGVAGLVIRGVEMYFLRRPSVPDDGQDSGV